MLNNKPLLLSIVGVLFLLKFVFVPVLDWQDRAIIETAALQTKIEKSQAYITELPEMREYKAQLQVTLNELKHSVDTYNDPSRYQISKQKQLEALCKEHKLTMTSTNWQDVVKTETGSTFQLQVQFKGMLRDFITLHMQLNAMGPSVEVRNLGLNMRSQSAKSLGSVTGNMVIVFSPSESSDAAI